MKRSFVIGATIILAIALIVMGVKISQHTKYENVFEEIYSITKTQETNIKSHEDKVYTYEVLVPKEELSNGIDSTVTTFHFEEDAGALAYLNGRTFYVQHIPFVEKYFPNYHI